MIRFKFKGKPVSIAQSDWDNIKHRFDHRNSVMETVHTSAGKKKRHTINQSCSLCDKYGSASLGRINCKGCPLNKFMKPSVLGFAIAGCAVFVREVLGEYPKFDMRQENLYYWEERELVVCRQLRRLLAFMAKKEEEK